ncbi:MlaD family protein [Patulibacter sp.]|uniref:MlaD family protein n=1 Tax=Patulibacter sp. TaxID=1912859 RepID=UPI002723AF84|nr:MlaD family protein [Patulibacter sp.]MDO9410013.1 MlaD family protein [Patulibacter sp.]
MAVAAVAALALAGCGRGEDASGVRIDALFDNASFVTSGQEVRVAGAPAGEVTAVTLTGDRRARISMRVEPRFAPFRADADCTILPQSLIGEKFVECDPGTPASPPLARGGGAAPTVPLSGTSSPVDLDLVLATFGEPRSTRFQLLVNELGAGLAARGDDLSDALRRAHPTLKYTKQAADALAGDEAALRRVIDATDAVLGELDRRRGRLSSTFERAADVLEVTADRRRALAEAVRRLPPSLASLRPALRALQALTRDARPTVEALRVAAPPVRTLARQLGPLADDARPALSDLARTARSGTRVLRGTARQLTRLRTTSSALAPVVLRAADLSRSLADNGAPSLLARFVLATTMATARFDGVSHILPAHVLLNHCIAAAKTPAPGCSARFADDGTSTKARP